MAKIAKAAPAVNPPLALLAAHPGWCIFPLRHGGKEPARGFTDFNGRASNDRDVIERWSREYPDCNWGLSLAKSRVIVLDCDTKPGKVGASSLELLELEHGQLPPTFEVRSVSGGRHIYLQQTADVQYVLRQNAFGQDIDSPPYTVLPGSYIIGKFTGFYRITHKLALAPAPKWLAEYLTPSAVGDNAVEQAPAVEQDTPDLIAWAIHYLKYDAPPAVQGRNGEHTLLMVAAVLKDHGISQHMAVELLTEHYNQRCEPAWEVGEGATADRLDVKVHNAWAYLKQTQPGAHTAAADFAADVVDSTDIKTMLAVYKANRGYSKTEAKKLRAKTKVRNAVNAKRARTRAFMQSANKKATP